MISDVAIKIPLNFIDRKEGKRNKKIVNYDTDINPRVRSSVNNTQSSFRYSGADSVDIDTSTSMLEKENRII